MEAGSTYKWELGDTANDQVVTTGNVTLQDTWNLNILNAGGTPIAFGVYDLFTYGTLTTSLSGDEVTSVHLVTDTYYDLSAAKVYNNAASKRVYISGLNTLPTSEWIVDASDAWGTPATGPRAYPIWPALGPCFSGRSAVRGP